MGRFSKRCGTLAQSMPTLAKRTKPWGDRSSGRCTISMPEPALQSGQIDCVPTKRRFWGTVPISSYCPLWGFSRFSTFGLDTLDTHTVLLPLWRARHASTTTTLVVVVHLCLDLMLIKHRWGASLSDVGLLHKACPHSQRGQSHEGIKARDVAP